MTCEPGCVPDGAGPRRHALLRNRRLSVNDVMSSHDPLVVFSDASIREDQASHQVLPRRFHKRYATS